MKRELAAFIGHIQALIPHELKDQIKFQDIKQSTSHCSSCDIWTERDVNSHCFTFASLSPSSLFTTLSWVASAWWDNKNKVTQTDIKNQHQCCNRNIHPPTVEICWLFVHSLHTSLSWCSGPMAANESRLAVNLLIKGRYGVWGTEKRQSSKTETSVLCSEGGMWVAATEKKCVTVIFTN